MTPEPGERSFANDIPAALLERRVLVMTGELDLERASQLAAALLTLDATGDEHVDLRLHSCHGSIDAALSLIDVVDVLGVPVHGIALGTVEGGPVGVFAATEHRRIAAHATLRLRAPDLTVEGPAREIEGRLAAHLSRREQFLSVLARRCGRPFAELDAEWDRGAALEAMDAVSLGYADGILGATVPPLG